MKPIVVYTEEEAARNAFAAEQLCALLGATLVTPDYDGGASFVVNRSNDYRVAERFEKRGIRVFNSAAFTRLANDKQRCYDFMEAHGIRIMPTRYRTPPFVKKPKNGHGGAGVVWCESEADYDDTAVCQKPASDLGKDLRVWVLGGEIVASFLRVNEHDFRSNFCLGGDAVPYVLNEEEERTVKNIIALVGGDYYGMDFVFDGGKAVFNELEDAVGARILYAKTETDVLAQYAAYIKKMMNDK